MKHILYRSLLFVFIISAAFESAASTWQLRSPLQYPNIFTQGFKLSCDIDDNDAMLAEDGSYSRWIVNPWGLAYYRSASSAFRCSKNCLTLFTPTTSTCCQNPCCKSEQVSIPGLIFGKESFRIEEAFADGNLQPEELGSSFNPGLSSLLVTPTLKYREKGVLVGANVQTWFEPNFADEEQRVIVGMRSYIPYRWVDMDITSLEEETQISVVDFPATLEGASPALTAAQGPRGMDFTYRIDYVRTAINFGNGTNPTTIKAGSLYSGELSATDPHNAPIYLVKRSSGITPKAEKVPETNNLIRFGKRASQVASALPADADVPDDGTYFFDRNTDYTALSKNSNLLRTLYAVPHVVVSGGGTETALYGGPTGTTAQTRDAMGWGMYGARDKQRPSQFFAQRCNINVRDGDSISGLGNLVTDFYVGLYRTCLALYGVVGLTYPTDRRVKNATRPYIIPPGNNNHYEIKFGTEGGTVFNIGGLKGEVDFLFHYNHVFKRLECRPAAFCGATLRNLGPTVTANVSWDYVLFRLDLSGFVTCCRGDSFASCYGLGAKLGYEFYKKSNDKLCFTCKTALDCYEQEKQLDSCLLEKCTNTTTNKILGKLFYSLPQCQFYFGGSQIFRGYSALVETELHLGVTATF